MKPYSNPQIKKSKDDKWYIEFNYAVPGELLEFYDRGTKRFKKYGDINMYSGKERDTNAEELRQDWLFCLKNLSYNPFEEELEELRKVKELEALLIKKETEQVQAPKATEEDLRKKIPISKALDLFIQSRGDRTDNGNSISTYRGTIKWLTEFFKENGRMNDPISTVRHLEISTAVMNAKKSRAWENSTYNNEITSAMVLFNWLATEEYMYKNPSKGRIQKLKTNKSKHKWYDRETAVIVKKALLEANCIPVYRAAQFTYHLCIRSKAELMKLQVSDIDRELKRVHFSAKLSKDGVECYRDYPPAFEKVLDEMDFDSLPKNFYLFGHKGVPGERKCHKDFLADQFRPVRDALELSDRYTIYGWKHTRAVHERMKKTDAYDIQHLLRHDSIKTTLDYLRDFDINLANVYKLEDLCF